MKKRTIKKITSEEYVEGELVKKTIEEITEEEDYSPSVPYSSYRPSSLEYHNEGFK